jgi:hypothetical protein
MIDDNKLDELRARRFPSRLKRIKRRKYARNKNARKV